MNSVRVWEEKVLIPTYETGPAEKNPMFLEKRVYQGSSGKVYPYPITEVISDECEDKEYTLVNLENDYLKVSILPELGGRIQRAIDKTNNYDFVYYNRVIKPALVGLTGPWISGGIEFNWPQHHRPSTYLPLVYELKEEENGSASVLVYDVDRMNGSQSVLRFTLYPDKAYIELSAELYNRTYLPQTFLWWANPAVPANEHTQSIFPPDVRFVMDHGKRDVSRFPISRSVYYKSDYSEGVDISYYRNIAVPTSYMVEKSDYDFIGNYDHQKQAGLLHVADHHISPGKKQWTWGHGDFGRAWDRNLTDEDGPYVELMTGVYTDNQPDFSWLKPFETKSFKQYFMPYKDVAVVKNASVDAALGVDFSPEDDSLEIRAYVTSVFDEVELCVRQEGTECYCERFALSPVQTYKKSILAEDLKLAQFKPSEMTFELRANGRELVSYKPEKEVIAPMPEAAKEPPVPEKVLTNEELLLIARHLEQIRHARTRPDAYYLEGLKRDPYDSRINTAYATLLARRGQFEEAVPYLERAVKRLSKLNLNPYDSETYEILGLCYWYQKRYDEAFKHFYKAAWTAEQQKTAYFYLAAISCRRQNFNEALDFIDRSLERQQKNIKARALKAYILRRLGRVAEASALVEENTRINSFDFLSIYEKHLLSEKSINCFGMWIHDDLRLLMVARDYADIAALDEAIAVLGLSRTKTPLILYYEAYYRSLRGEDAKDLLTEAEAADPAYCFPNSLEDIAVLEYAIESSNGPKANYYLGNLLYDRRRWEEAEIYWQRSREQDPSFPTVARNLSQLYANKRRDYEQARLMIDQAFELDPGDARVFMERDQLYRQIGVSFARRLEEMEKHPELLKRLDPLYVEYITLLNLNGRYEDAYQAILEHRFHPWEGGEGKITAQYELALIAFAEEQEGKGDLNEAMACLKKALVYPENLGEGKLAGTKDNHLYYRLGRLAKLQGREDEAVEYFKLATLGVTEVSPALYYNDQPVDMIYYQGLAWEELGEAVRSKSAFSRLIDAGEQRFDAEVKADFFAVSLPEMTVYEEDEQAINKANCCYLMGLGYLGLKNKEKAVKFLKDALRYDPSHMKAFLYAKEARKQIKEN